MTGLVGAQLSETIFLQNLLYFLIPTLYILLIDLASAFLKDLLGDMWPAYLQMDVFREIPLSASERDLLISCNDP